MESRSVAMDFKLVVEQTSDIKDGYCSGLQALGHNADLVSVVEPRNLEVSTIFCRRLHIAEDWLKRVFKL